MLRRVGLDGSPERVGALVGALDAALHGGRPVLPLGGVDPEPEVPADPADGTAVVIATSGSTGQRKLVQLPATALVASARATADRLGGPARWLLALPAEHVAGVQVIVRSLLAGHRPLVQDLRGGFRADAFAAATAGLGGGGRRCTSLVPTQLLRLLDAGGAALDALRSYQAVLIGGAALDPALHDRAAAAGVAVVRTYGMSETAGGCVYDGVPLDGVRLDLAADGGIRLGGPTLATGYLGQPAATAAAFTDGWFRTGDLGRLRDGRLDVLGRIDDVIITGGRKVAPAVVERALLAQPGVRAACAVGLADPEWGQVVAAAVVLDPAAPADLPGLAGAVRGALGPAGTPRRLLAVAQLPLLGIGKPDRRAVAEMITGDRHPAG